ncbi:hypothetical protein ACIP1U_32410 [Cupriavidus sp. NPDC089707]|uniref:hypothetical protein n=1 Tax=Cupriavidus sp. NPDC089707 TaxID=3363963 RepID=UPI00382F3C68
MKIDISRAIALLPVTLLVMTVGCAPQQAMQGSSSAQSVESSDSSPSRKPIESNSSAAQPVEFYPGYPPAWVKNYKNLPPEVIPGAKLGDSKEESAKRLRPEIRELLDVARRFYYDPALLSHRREMLEFLHVGSTTREVIETRMQDGALIPHFREDFRSGGLFSNPAWRGYYLYRGFEDELPRERWGVDISVKVDGAKDCVDSKAVEGYLDVPLDPGLWPPGLHPVPPERWNRHGKESDGSLVARSPSQTTGGLEIGFAKGCLVRLEFGATYNLNKVSNEDVLRK